MNDAQLARRTKTGREVEQLYGDLLYLPHPVSRSHHPMARAMRAAQFAPFAALTGYEEMVEGLADPWQGLLTERKTGRGKKK